MSLFLMLDSLLASNVLMSFNVRVSLEQRQHFFTVSEVTAMTGVFGSLGGGDRGVFHDDLLVAAATSV